MTPTRRRRAATGITALALALGTAAPASAMPAFQSSSPNIQHATASDSEWAYVAIGGGAAGLALLGVGGAVAVSRRRERQARPPRSTIAA